MGYEHPLEISNAGARLLASVALSDHDAVTHVDALGVIERFTFAEVARQAAQWAQLLREKGLEPGDRVVVVAGREWGWRCALLGVLQAGGVGVPLPESTPVADIRAIAGAADAALLVSPRASPDLVDRSGRPVLSADQLETVDEAEAWAHPPHQSMPGDVALILFARHAAGPRGAMHTHESLIAQAKAGEHWLGVGEDERLWSTATEGSAASTWLLLAAWRERASIVIVDLELDPGAQLELLGRLRLAAVWFSDAEYDALASMTAPPWVELDSIRRALTTDESADGAIAFAGAFGAAVAPLFGLKELGVVAGWPGGSEGEALGGTGLPVAGIQLAIVDEQGSELPAGQVGDVIVRGDAQSLFSGYIGGTAPRRDSWFDMRWQGALSADGRLRVVSRSPVETELVEAEVDLPGAELGAEVEPAVPAVAEEPEPPSRRSKREAKRARREEERLANQRRTDEERERREEQGSRELAERSAAKDRKEAERAEREAAEAEAAERDQREAAAAAAEERRRTEAAREREAADAEERRRADQAAHAEAEKGGGRRQRREEKQARRREEQLAKEREKAEAAERARREAAEVEERKRADAEARAEEHRRAKEKRARAKAEKRGPGRRQRREEKQARRREEQLAKERAKAEAAEHAQREAAEAEDRKRAEEAARAEDRRRVEDEKQREQERRREEKETRRREEQEAKEAARAERRAARAGARGRAEGSQPAETGRRRKRARRSEPVEQGEPERLSSDILSRINQYGMSNSPEAPDEAPDADASAQSQVAAEPNERGDVE
jgi:acyl-coenzyme A synthetase/AMP-(fatty) acid ligase